MPNVNRRMLLTSRPSGRVALDNFTVDEAAIPEPGEGEALIRTLYVSLDPTNRVWMVGRTRICPRSRKVPSCAASGLGHVSPPIDERYRLGDLVVGMLGWQDYCDSRRDR